MYLVASPRLAAAKIGICEDSPKNTRLADHRRAGWNVVETMRFSVGAEARAVENGVVRYWRRSRFPVVLDNGLAYVGYTETVPLSEVSVVEIWTMVCVLAGREMP